MNALRTWIAAGAIALLAPVNALAQDAAPAEAAPITLFAIDETCQEVSQTLEQDQREVEEAIVAINGHGYPGLSHHLGDLRDVVARAPSCFPESSRRGEVIVMRGDTSSALILGVLASAATQGQATQVVNEPNTYPLAYLLLASYDVETGQHESAINWLTRGLALQPNNQSLLFEQVAALLGLRRYQEAADLLQGMIDNPALALTLDEARAYRSLGVALIDVGRLDDAEAALNESIRIEPNNPGARHELRYIAELRRGAPQRELELNSPAAQPEQK